MHKANLSRRGFIQRVFAGAVASGLPVWYAQELAAQQVRKSALQVKAPGPNDRIIVGLIGCGLQGRALLKQLRTHKAVECHAVCDVDKGRREAAAQEAGKGCGTYEDFRQLLDHKGVNAVIIATPDHWHTIPAIEALRRGKDVYCEAPLTLTIDEGKALVRAAKQTGRVFQVGSQQRSDKFFRLACELVQNGRLGKIQSVETWVGVNPKGGPFPSSMPPEGLNWDLWLGQAPQVDYVKERCFTTFRWWYDYSGGKLTDWGAHHIDIAQWALGTDDTGPLAVEAVGEAPSTDPRSYNCHPTFKATFTYASGVKLICTGDDDKKNGVRFEGEGGKWLFVTRNNKLNGSDKMLIEEKLPNDARRLQDSSNHLTNWLDAIRGGKPCICPAEVGHRSATICHLGVIALRTGKKLTWDPNKEQCDDAAVNKWLGRAMRPPWKLV